MRRSAVELRPWVKGEEMSRVSISLADRQAGSPMPGDMIARNPRNHDDQWLVNAQFFRENYEPVDDPFANGPVEITGKD